MYDLPGTARSLHAVQALSGHVFGKGLKLHAVAMATYHKASQHLTVHSGSVTDTLTLISPHGMSFAIANDGHGGSKVTLHPPATSGRACCIDRQP